MARQLPEPHHLDEYADDTPLDSIPHGKPSTLNANGKRGKLQPYQRPPIDLPTSPGYPIWEKLKDEPSKAFEGFRLYRDLGPDERTVVKAERTYRSERNQVVPKDSRASVQFTNWSRRYRWVERAQAFDAHNDRKMIEHQKRMRIQTAKRHAEQQQKLQAVVMHPIEKYNEKLLQIAAGEHDELNDLTQEELIRLVRNMAGLLTDSERGEREALKETTSLAEGPTSDLKAKGDRLRVLLANPQMIAMVESLQFNLGEDEPAASS